MSENWRGIFTIPATPFNEDWSVDWDGLVNVTNFCVECGAHGIVWPVNASGFTTLTDEERLKGMQLVVDTVAGRAPVVLGTAGVCTEHAVMFSKRANEVGADAIIAMAPYVKKITDANGLISYYRAISDAIDVPIFVQNHAVGTDMPASILGELVRQVEHVVYIKEETLPVTHKITQLAEMEMPKLRGIFGGSGGRYMLLEYPRGVCGQMPGCHVTDVMVRYWNALEEDDWDEAKKLYGLLSPLYAIEVQCRGAIYKETLKRRGVIKSSRSRNAPPNQMDEFDHRSLDDILRDLEPYFTWPNRTPLEFGVSHPEATSPSDLDIAPMGGAGGLAPFDQQ